MGRTESKGDSMNKREFEVVQVHLFDQNGEAVPLRHAEFVKLGDGVLRHAFSGETPTEWRWAWESLDGAVYDAMSVVHEVVL